MAKIGLVAGEGRLPIVLAKEARRRGDEVVAFGVTGLTDAELEKHVAKMHWFEWGELQKAFMTILAEGLRKIVFLGKINKSLLFKEGGDLDEKSKNFLAGLKDKKDYSVLKKIQGMLKLIGAELLDATDYLEGLVPEKGVLSRRRPTGRESSDIEVGRTIARELARWDIGQTVCVKDGCVIAMEAAEGTDETIRRAGALSEGGFTVVKMARPEQDMRLDVPLVGPDTVRTLSSAGARVLALEGKKTILMDREEVISIADEAGIAIIIV